MHAAQRPGVRFIAMHLGLRIFLLCFLASGGWAQTGQEAALANEYFNDGEYARALPLYEKLLREQPTADFYAYRIVDCFLFLGEGQEAIDFAEKLARKAKGRPQMIALLGHAQNATGNEDAADATWNTLLKEAVGNYNGYMAVANFFMQIHNYDWAAKTYLQAREVLNDPNAFSLPLARLYAAIDRAQDAVVEFLRDYTTKKGEGDYQRLSANILNLVREHNQDAIEKTLLQASVNAPRNLEFRQLLYDFYLRTENYPEAVVQAKSIFRLKDDAATGQQLLQLGQTLQVNGEYALSNDVLDYLIEQAQNSPFRLRAYFEKAKNFELAAAEQRPVEASLVRQAVANYDALFARFGRRADFADAMFRKARLLVFELSQLDSALNELDHIERLPISSLSKADARLLRGDILLLKGDYPAAEKQYQQVADASKEEQIGAQARFSISRLNYFQGDFDLAKSRLKILKDNAANDIANDAIQLYLTIIDNIGLDTTDKPLRLFATAQLNVMQHQYQAARPLLEGLLKDYPQSELIDNVRWELAQVALKQGDIGETKRQLEFLLQTHADDVLADDALFLLAELYERSLNDSKKARELYLDLLKNHPDSLYKVEAQRRIRQLRGERIPSG